MDSESAIARLEQRIGVSLPSEYREFLANDPDYDPGWLDQLFPLFGPDNVESRWNLLCQNDYLPMQGYLPIGDDGCGNEALLKIRGEGVGTVWFWNHEHGDELVRLSDTFSEIFQRLLGPEPD